MLDTQLIDSLLLVMTVLSSAAFTYFINRRRPSGGKGMVFTFLFVFLAQYTLLNICAHLVAVSVVAGIKMRAGSFVYDMRFYTLIQFGVLLALLNGYLFRGVRQVCLGKERRLKNMVVACCLQMLISFPLFPFNPLSLLPVMTSLALMLLLVVARRKSVYAQPSAAVETAQKMQLA
ncbi:hypothetical protein [Rufibacter hautae]|uniref:Uncharacterized protein n=1 Tax=Rufibacter hautae TaxID=2595005 RepID=A0A5B6THK9_9BACT|nr:hypothetical protein [Rufibacter hautae]KAA3438805.1 hypothetical protein FOA19_16455 [Rufibacter hautae]